MGISLGWVVFFAAGVTAAPPAERNAAPIAYTIKMVEANGVGWREAVFTRMKPVARQGAATVWTIPKSSTKRIIEHVTKDHAGRVLQAPRITALPGVPATVQVRENRKFVTQVAWNEDESAANSTLENFRVGWHTTVIGRKLDQGVLVKIVIEDTEIRGVHKVNLDQHDKPQVRKASHFGSAKVDEERTIADAYASAYDNRPFVTGSLLDHAYRLKGLMERARIAYAEGRYIECEALANEVMAVDPHGKAAAMLVHKAMTKRRNGDAPTSGTGSVEQVAFEFPEIANEEVFGEWLIPKGECLLVSFGPHTVADQDGKAVVRERLAFVEAEENTDVTVNSTAPFSFIPAPAPAIAPRRAQADAAPIAAPAPMPGPPVATELAPVPAPAAPDAKLPTPTAPSRSFPQGVHTDGSKAKLPPLPDDEMEEESAESESAEPLPSPQSKKPRTPKPEPASDAGTTKAVFTQSRPSNVFLPSVFLPGASVGFQFLLPIRPLSIRLPFNQRLEIEIFGRVVPDTRVTAP